MSPLRAVLPLTPPTHPARVLVYAPRLYDGGFKQHHVDGEALALHTYLRAAGHDSTLLDAYYRTGNPPTLSQYLSGAGLVDVVVAHLWTSDAYGPRLAAIADDLATARTEHRVPILGFGPLATSAAPELLAHGAIDHAIGTARERPSIVDPRIAAVADAAAHHLTGHTPLTALTREEVPYQPDAVVSVSASRGCRGRCTFCAYNADLGGGWTQLPVAAAVADIAHLHRLTGTRRFAFADTDFGGTRDECHLRAYALRAAIDAQGLTGRVKLSISVRSETLTPATVALLAEAGVNVMLIGVESLNPTTLHRLYGKRQDLDHLHQIISAADAAGVTTVASYILWHPWQTLQSLRGELAAIDVFGRHRIPQFLTRSRLLVIPGTVIETRIRLAGLLDEARFHRGFRFADPDTAALYQDLTGWFRIHARPVLAGLSEQHRDDLATLARLKIAEWRWLTNALGVAPSPATGVTR